MTEVAETQIEASTKPTPSGPHPLKVAGLLELDRGARLDPADTLGNLSLLLASPTTWGEPGVPTDVWERAQVDAIVRLASGWLRKPLHPKEFPKCLRDVRDALREMRKMETSEQSDEVVILQMIAAAIPAAIKQGWEQQEIRLGSGGKIRLRGVPNRDLRPSAYLRWLRNCVENIVLEMTPVPEVDLRWRNWAKHEVLDIDLPEGRLDSIPDGDDPAFALADAYIARELRAAIFRRLTKDQRPVFRLYLDGLSPEEIAARLGKRRSTVDVHLSNAKKRAKARLGDFYLQDAVLRKQVTP